MASRSGTGLAVDGSPRMDKMAMILRLSDVELKKIERAGSLQIVTGGPNPMLKFASHSLNLTMSPEKFTRELYASQDSIDFRFLSQITYRARIMRALSKEEAQDPALQALSNELAAYKKEKEASQTHLNADTVLPIPKNRREAAQQQKRGGYLAVSKRLGQSSPALAASQVSSQPPTSVPQPYDANARRIRAQRVALIHFLATGDATTADIAKATHITDNELKDLLKTAAHSVDGKWRLSDKTFKELTPWRFKYSKTEDRKAAIDNAIRAYDRMRLSKSDEPWQTLLPVDERGKGKVLSRLHLSSSQQTSTPRLSSPAYQSSAANTPHFGPSGTPKLGAKKSGGDVMKRLLSKDPKKARAADEAKEMKRKERESQDNDADARPTKKQAVSNKNKPIAKSEEFVHSSSEEDPVAKSAPKPSAVKQTSDRTPSSNASQSLKPTANANKPAAGKSTPQLASTNTTAVKNRAHISPPKPTVPSPLGAARPRVTSDVSDRSGITHKRLNTAEPPRSIAATSTPSRKRHDTVTSMDSNEDARRSIKTGDARPQLNGSSKHKPKQTVPQSDTQETTRKSSASTATNTQSSEDRFDGGTSDSSMSITDHISFEQGTELAEKFKAELYPEYAKLYDTIADKTHRGEAVSDADYDRLLGMQDRLARMKRDIETASTRQNAGNSS